MTNNICKKCGREIPQGQKSCTYCKNKHNEKNGDIIKGALGVLGTIGAIALGVFTKGKIGGGKS